MADLLASTYFHTKKHKFTIQKRTLSLQGHRVFHTLGMLTDEKKAFAERLKIALKRSVKPVETGAELALQFNLRHPHEPVTPQAAQQWLRGVSRPKADKIATLAEWLNVSPHWLQYGSPRDRQATPNQAANQTAIKNLSDAEQVLVGRLRQLTVRQQALIADLVEELAEAREVWPTDEP